MTNHTKPSDFPVAIDFETEAIRSRPAYPPRPVGVSIKYFDCPAKYFAFEHASENNCEREEARVALEKAYDHPAGVLFHNAKFDLDVADVWLGLKIPAWSRVHDTMLLLFLCHPHAKSLGLKAAATLLLGHAPAERDAVEGWLLDNQPVPGVVVDSRKKSDTYFARYIWHAPGGLVGAYANSDTSTTAGLFELLYPTILACPDLLRAYNRERELLPILLDMERRGLRVDLESLRGDFVKYSSDLLRIEEHLLLLLARLAQCPGYLELNLDSSRQLVDALLRAGLVSKKDLLYTKKGSIKTDKKSLFSYIKDANFLALLIHRKTLQTCLRNFMTPWLKMAEASNGLIFTTWNQVRSYSTDGFSSGARTGRLSSSPNFQNIPKVFDASTCPLSGISVLPNMRSYIIPFKGHTFVDRDYCQQEVRILAHFSGDKKMLQAYTANPGVDFYTHTQQELAVMGLVFSRDVVKSTTLGIIYGMGVATLAVKNEIPIARASQVIGAILRLYPGIDALRESLRVTSELDRFFITWGGRKYKCEPAKVVDGRISHFHYKMINVKIQGSAADCLKEALIQFYRVKLPSWLVVLTGHDQITVSVPLLESADAMGCLKECMEGVDFKVDMLTEGSTASSNWAELRKDICG
jgi:DNA polymerase-1